MFPQCQQHPLVHLARELSYEFGIHIIPTQSHGRVGSITTAIDPSILQKWRKLTLQSTLCETTRRDVRIVNDATLAALGCSRGSGREFVVTLGTGFGTALVVDDVEQRIRDVGAEQFADGDTYDELLGKPSRCRNEDT